ncbi:MinD/ParA family protein [Nocardioides guangzhouensis]|uniref:MinD/ParA family protein n=1 Tax=Nocardioides guangzhouensis TaxID=2497878 RepID=A0A4Q4Z8X1_9ACTN|nr:MinD/ParA family protein [Nocardioides guangzhouensis]RYP84272.1 MinD/ParA family protein [Nocardioides guangzhouensis]
MNQATEHGYDVVGEGRHIPTQDPGTHETADRNDAADRNGTAPSGAARHAASTRWRRTPDLDVLGQSQDSGLRDPTYLVRRWDDQVLQLSELLYLVLIHLEPFRSPEEVASLVSDAHGRTLTPAGLEYVVTTRLSPLGLAEEVGDGSVPPSTQALPRANPLLALTVKGTIVPPYWSRRVAGWLHPLYWPPVVVLGVLGMVALDIYLYRTADFWLAVQGVFLQPTQALLMYVALTAAALVHEVGHATACRYGGARPGAIGVGLYIVFPAFYTDVTDSYRLSRGGRVRTDLGGLYFNAWCVVVMAAAYLQTGWGVMLLSLVVLQVQMLQQLLPVVRFDGYYVLADLAGVPDLFSRVGPVLRSLRPGQPPDPRVQDLTPRARRLVTGWVLVVVPLLVFVIGWLVWSLPEFVDSAREGIRAQQDAFALAWPERDVAMMALSTISIFLILVPLVGVAVILWKLVAPLVALARARSRRAAEQRDAEAVAAAEAMFRGSDDPAEANRVDPAIAAAVAAVPVPRLPSAADFSDDNMLPRRAVVPTSGWRRAVFVLSGHSLNPGLSPAEQRRAALEARLRTPIEGSRRVVVMSRKGGVGKTTMTLALGSIFAMLRGDRVVAVDANPDAGNLAHRVAPPRDRKITDVLRDVDRIDSYSRLRDYTSQAEESRLEVLASDDDPRIGQALDRDDYHGLITLLDRFYNLILLDTGTGILDSANQGLLEEADQLVVVLGPGLDGGRAAALTLDWMDEHGFEELVSRAVVVINGLRKGADSPHDLMQNHFEKRCQHVLTVPWDPALEVGAQTNLSGLRRQTRDDLVQLAAAVADNFREQGLRR